MKQVSRRIVNHVSHAAHSLTRILRKAGTRQILRAGLCRRSALALVVALVIVAFHSVPSPAFFRVKNLTGRDYRGGGSFSGIADLRIGRTGHTATTLQDGRILIVGGENERGAVADAERGWPNSGVHQARGPIHRVVTPAD